MKHFENTTILTQEINKLRLQILEALHIEKKNSKINRINYENSDNVLKCLRLFFKFLFIHLYLIYLFIFIFSQIFDNILFPLILFSY